MSTHELTRKFVGLSLIATSLLGSTACSHAENTKHSGKTTPADCRHDGLLTGLVIIDGAKEGGLNAKFTGECVELYTLPGKPNGHYLYPDENIRLDCHAEPNPYFKISSMQGAEGYGSLAPEPAKAYQSFVEADPQLMPDCLPTT